jgi:hypothetical protein
LNKFEKATFKAFRKPEDSWENTFCAVAGYKFGNTGLGYYKAENEGYYVMHLASGMSMGNPLAKQAQVKGIVTEAAGLAVDWTLGEQEIIGTVLPDGTKLGNKYMEVYWKYGG